MEHLITLPRALERAAERTGYGFTFVHDDLREEEHTWASLLERARSIAVALRERGMKKGDHVALVLPEAGEFVPTFLGVAQGGGVPVPLYPPMGVGQLGGYLDHCKHIVGASRAGLLITNRQIKAVLGTLHDHAPSLREMLTYADLEGDASLFRDPGLTPDDPCFIQFTSGSTSKPKGVVVSHGNLAHNAWAVMRDGLASHDEDRGVSWLPLFHDMGLIGFVIAPIHHRVPVTFMSPMTFLKRPVTWLEILSKHRGTITYGPNFSYAITAKRVRERDLEGLDLSCVRVAGCGAEPIQADTLRAFADRFSAIGFREQAFVPSYGMAEYTLAIAFSTGVPTDRVRSEPLWSRGVAEPAAEGDDPADLVEIVGCGRGLPLARDPRGRHRDARAPAGSAGRRDRGERSERDAGLLRDAREDARDGERGRVAAHRRSGLPRGRLDLHLRPRQGRHHRQRQELLPAGSRVGGLRGLGRTAGQRDRLPEPQGGPRPRGGGGGRRDEEPGRPRAARRGHQDAHRQGDGPDRRRGRGGPGQHHPGRRRAASCSARRRARSTRRAGSRGARTRVSSSSPGASWRASWRT
ncbi:MAG: AMP-binding protein [Sandaracinaceae bacterium]|nr:AMP-binding protein [Sandaracinaceae bacterium]